MKKTTKFACYALALGQIAMPAQADDILELYKFLHANPEVSMMETKTAALLADKLDKLGFKVTRNVGGTGVVAVMKNGPGDTLMIRADMDGLPVKEKTGLKYASQAVVKDRFGEDVPAMHACGHDVHMASLIGTAQNLVAEKGNWSGTLVLNLQPGEEIGQGARRMLDDGLFTRFPRPDYNLALHDNAAMPAGKIGMSPGYALANVDSVDIVVKGVGGHGAYPQTTKDPVVLAAQIVMALQTIVSRETAPIDPAVVTVGSIHGGTKHNIIPDEVTLQLTLRSYSDEVRESTIAAIRRIVEGLAQAADIPQDLRPVVTVKDEFTPATYNDPEFTEWMFETIGKAIGTQNVEKMKPVMGGEDFGRYGRVDPKIPSLIFWVGAVNPKAYDKAMRKGESLPSLHSPYFAPDPKPTLDTAVAAMTAAATEILKK